MHGQVVIVKAVTKADFCLASREQPSVAVGIYAHRIVRRSRWLFWSECYAEYLVSVIFSMFQPFLVAPCVCWLRVIA